MVMTNPQITYHKFVASKYAGKGMLNSPMVGLVQNIQKNRCHPCHTWMYTVKVQMVR